MPFVLRTTTEPTLAEIASVPQIVIIDLTGPAVFLGTATKSVLLVGEFLKGSYSAYEVTSPGEVFALYGGVSPYFSQSAAGLQDGSGVTYNGNGMLQLKGRKFKRLVLVNVDREMMTTDGGSTKGTLALTLTIAAGDQATGFTNKDLVIPAGTRLTDQAIGTATVIVVTSQDIKIPKGTTVTANALTVNANVYSVKQPDPIVSIASSTIDTVVDSFVESASAGTSITAVAQGTALWPPGTGTTLSARIESRYLTSIDGTMPIDKPLLDVGVIWSARRSSVAGTYAIQKRLLQNARDASANSSVGRVALYSPDPAAGIAASDAASAKTAMQGYAAAATLQNDRAIGCWPHIQVFTEELGNINVTVSPEAEMAMVLNSFPEEYNPGAANGGLMDNIVALEPCFVTNGLVKADYQLAQAAGICAIRKDRKASWWFENGVTSVDPVAQPTRVPIKRRRMADLIQEGLIDIAARYLKQPATTDRVDAFEGEQKVFLEGLLSRNDPKRQRIVDYGIKNVSTRDQKALGIYTWEVSVQTLPSLDNIVFRTSIGETVTVPVQQVN